MIGHALHSRVRMAVVVLVGAVIVFASGCIGTDTAPTAEPTVAVAPALKTSKTIISRAQSWYTMLESGHIDRSHITPRLNDVLTKEKVRQLSGQLRALGKPKSFTPLDQGVYGDSTFWRFRVKYEHTTVLFTFAVDPHNRVSGLLLGHD
jgi:hypothetical protein